MKIRPYADYLLVEDVKPYDGDVKSSLIVRAPKEETSRDLLTARIVCTGPGRRIDSIGPGDPTLRIDHKRVHLYFEDRLATRFVGAFAVPQVRSGEIILFERAALTIVGVDPLNDDAPALDRRAFISESDVLGVVEEA